MNKNELLAKAMESFTIPPNLREFAEKPLTEAEASNRYATACVTVQRWTRATHRVQMSAFFVGLLLAVCAIIADFAHTGRTVSTPPIGFVVFILTLIGGAVAWFFASAVMVLLRFCACNNQDIAYLAPLAGTHLCEQGLKDLQYGGPNVLAWRDLALQERSQLRVFDYHVMAALRRVYEKSKMANAEKERLDVACRALHGLPNPESPQSQ